MILLMFHSLISSYLSVKLETILGSSLENVNSHNKNKMQRYEMEIIEISRLVQG